MNSSIFSLNGKVALVTGARRGVGRAIALTMADAGADVVICDSVIEGGELMNVSGEIKKLGRRCIARQVDITSKREVENLVSEVVSEFGAIDILVNNAGVGSDPPLLETSEEEWQRILDINLKGALLCCQTVSKIMIEKARGNIVNIASAAGIKAFASKNTYNISKAGVIMFTKILARELGKYNIRVNAIAPAVVQTDMSKDLTDDPKMLASEVRRTPIGRLAEPKDIAGPALFLVSDASSCVTGHILVVDGGQLT